MENKLNREVEKRNNSNISNYRRGELIVKSINKGDFYRYCYSKTLLIPSIYSSLNCV